jgi:hypothetical protein
VAIRLLSTKDSGSSPHSTNVYGKAIGIYGVEPRKHVATREEAGRSLASPSSHASSCSHARNATKGHVLARRGSWFSESAFNELASA